MSKLTSQKAIEMSIDLWQWLYENPLVDKTEYPKYYKIKNMCATCPCCEKFGCDNCPLSQENLCDFDSKTGYFKWKFAKNKKESKRNSKAILNTLKKYYKEKYNK